FSACSRFSHLLKRNKTWDTSVVLNVLSSRESNSSTLITSQFEPADWYKSIADAVLAESILSRLIGQAQIINIDGPNLRINKEQEN
ncbi:ATP-binding protein, partial [Corynebacterium flavescens]|uniref:ATP-binding protein n=1 Tax=Corynebacterium flavescens TaxID=28028 RepID=UPI003FCFD835